MGLESKTTLNSDKPKRVIFLQWFFLAMTLLLAAFHLKYSYNPSLRFQDGYAIFFLLVWYLPILALIGITVSLFLYSEKTRAIVVSLAIAIAVVVIFLFQFPLFLGLLSIWGLSLSEIYDPLSPVIKDLLKNNFTKLMIIHSTISFISIGFFFGAPLLLVYILNRVLKGDK